MKKLFLVLVMAVYAGSAFATPLTSKDCKTLDKAREAKVSSEKTKTAGSASTDSTT
jgi:hypothetical protein